jgi:hypothetical protein
MYQKPVGKPVVDMLASHPAYVGQQQQEEEQKSMLTQWT